jgi:hypothetical protein
LAIAGASTRRPLAPLGPKLTTEELSVCVTRLDGRVLVTEPEFVHVAEGVGSSSLASRFRSSGSSSTNSLATTPASCSAVPCCRLCQKQLDEYASS